MVPPGVQPIAGMAHVLGRAVPAEVRDGDRVLDMGTGSGVNAILAASRSTDVVAVDVNPLAVAAARANAERLGLSGRIAVRESDVFRAVDGVFDLVVFDPPFRWFAARDPLEPASTEDYRAMTAFFAGVRERLAAGGPILLFFGTSGDVAHLHERIAAAELRFDVVASAELVRNGWRVEYVTLRLTA